MTNRYGKAPVIRELVSLITSHIALDQHWQRVPFIRATIWVLSTGVPGTVKYAHLDHADTTCGLRSLVCHYLHCAYNSRATTFEIRTPYDVRYDLFRPPRTPPPLSVYLVVSALERNACLKAVPRRPVCNESRSNAVRRTILSRKNWDKELQQQKGS